MHVNHARLWILRGAIRIRTPHLERISDAVLMVASHKSHTYKSI